MVTNLDMTLLIVLASNYGNKNDKKMMIQFAMHLAQDETLLLSRFCYVYAANLGHCCK